MEASYDVVGDYINYSDIRSALKKANISLRTTDGPRRGNLRDEGMGTGTITNATVTNYDVSLRHYLWTCNVDVGLPVLRTHVKLTGDKRSIDDITQALHRSRVLRRKDLTKKTE